MAGERRRAGGAARRRVAEFRKRRADRKLDIQRLETRWLLSAYNVTTTGDAGPGSLRDAINQVDAGTYNTIDFNINAGGFQTISVGSALPAITRSVTIDGTSQPGYTSVPLIQLDGSGAGTGVSGLVIDASNVTIRGLVVGGFNRDGIDITNAATGVLIAGDDIGTYSNVSNFNVGNSAYGILLTGGATHNTIGGTTAADRVVVGDNNFGIVIDGAAGNLVEGSYLGLNILGTTAEGDNNNEVWIRNGSIANTIGGGGAGQGNVISGDVVGPGIQLEDAGTSGNVIQGNIIGLDVNGATGVGNKQDGIRLDLGTADNTIGGAGAAGNTIGGNGDSGINLTESATSGNLIVGNRIGTSPNGNAGRGNGNDGIIITDARDNTIGSLTVRNTISANANAGIEITGDSATGNLIGGDYIGVDAAGSGALPNGGGILLNAGFNTINGGGGASPGNIIAGNTAVGIQVRSGASTYTGLPATTLIEGSWVGINSIDGALPNGFVQIDSFANGVQIGGAAAQAGNVVAATGTSTDLIRLESGASGDLVQGNTIGLRATGTAALGGGSGVGVSGPGATITGNLIGGTGVAILLGGATATGTLITGNTIGDAVNAVPVLGNQYGIFLQTNATDNTIGGTSPVDANVIVGNSNAGITIATTADRTLVVGNHVGIDLTGSTAYGNLGGGIVVNSADNTLGGAGAAANVISGNGNDGIAFSGATATGNLVVGNLVGTDATGAAALGNAGGVNLSNGAAFNTIGGDGGGGNTISGNTADGVSITGTATRGNVFLGNRIGTDALGTAALANGGDGVYLLDAPNNILGDLTGGGNTISGNALHGVYLDGGATGDVLLGDFIGVDATGLVALPNLAYGVYTNAASTTIGDGSVAAPENVIAGNGTGNIFIDGNATGTVVKGSYVGYEADGSATLTSPSVPSIYVAAGNVTIGGAGSHPGNLIGGGTAGVVLDAAGGDLVQGNTLQGNTQEGLSIQSPGNTVSTNLIIGDTVGILLTSTTFSAATSNHIAGNTVGDAVDAVPGVTNQIGIQLAGNATGNTIGGGSASEANVISGNTGNGVELDGNANANLVTGNLIGTDAGGTLARGNGDHGILVQTAGNTIGVGGAGTLGNLVAASGDTGIRLQGAATGNVVAGNTVGDAIHAVATIGNQVAGIGLGPGATNNTIGGATAAARNVVSGNVDAGIALTAGADDNLVEGNYVGTDATGTLGRGNGNSGIRNSSSGNTIGGTSAATRNVISANQGNGIVANGGAGVLIEGNYVGTDTTGTVALANQGSGLYLGGTTNVTVGGAAAGAGNVISGNATDGVVLDGASASAIQGNIIGLDRTGTAALGNAQDGVVVENGSSGNTIGGLTATPGSGAGNLISGNTGGFNTGRGIIIFGAGVGGNVVLGNVIGLDRNGASLGNFNGVQIAAGATGNIVGGPDPQARNVVSGNQNAGIAVEADDTLVQGNFVGVDTGGTLARPNEYGIGVFSSQNTIGGGAAGDGNLISGNATEGVDIEGASASGNVVEGNSIGTDLAGSSALANTTGVRIVGGALNNVIGGVGSGLGNTIAFNQIDGVTVGDTPSDPSTGNAIRGNSIFGNAQLGIDLGGDGVTKNVYGHPLSGPNDFENFPIVGQATPSAGGTQIVGSLNSQPDQTYILDFYANPAADPSGYGQGQTYLGSTTVTTAATGNATYVFNAPVNLQGQQITATATAPDGSTSEFALDQLADAPPVATITAPAGGASFAVGQPIAFNALAGAYRYSWYFGDGGTDLADPSTTATHTFHDYGTYDVLLVATDAAGVSSSDNVNITITDAPPTITPADLVLSPSTINEGGTVSLSGTFTDPRFTPTTTLADTVSVDWGDGSDPTTVTLAAGATSFSGLTHTYADAPAAPATTYPITVTVTDPGAGAGNPNGAFNPDLNGTPESKPPTTTPVNDVATATIPVTVTNVVSLANVQLSASTVNEGSAVTITGSILDPGTVDGHTVVITWGDGLKRPDLGAPATTTIYLPAFTPRNPDGSIPFTATRTFPDNTGAGLSSADTINVLAADDDGASASQNLALTVNNLPPVVSTTTSIAPDGSQITVTGAIHDPGPLDTFTYQWAINGVVQATGSGPGPDPIVLAFPSSPNGQYLVTLTATDGDGASTTASAVIVVGTEGNDVIHVSPVGTGQVDVTSNGQDLGHFNNPSVVVILGLDGNDDIEADPTLTVPLEVHDGAGNDTIVGGAGNDSLYGGPGNDSLFGGAGNDTLVGQHGNDYYSGGTGNNTYVVVPGSDSVLDASSNNTAGTDTIDLSGANLGITLDLSKQANQTQTVDSVGNTINLIGQFEGVVTSNYNDTIIGNSANDTIVGGAGSDTVVAGTGTDLIKGGSGSLSVTAGTGDATVFSAGTGTSIGGGSGNVTIYDQGNTSIGGGSGNVTIYNNNPSLSGGSGNGTVYIGNTTIGGGSGNVTIYNSGGTSIGGGSGNVTIYNTNTSVGGGSGNVTIYSGSTTIGGGSGNTTIYNQGSTSVGGGSGNTTIYNNANASIGGGSGNTTIYNNTGSIGGGAGNSTIYIGNASITGGSGNSTIYNSGDATITGGSGNSTIYNTNTSITGGNGNTTIYVGNSSITGGSGNTTIYNNSGNASITGGSGNTTIYNNGTTIGGGSGNGTIYLGNATITGGSGNTTIYNNGTTVGGGSGDGGNATVTGGGGTTTIVGGAGSLIDFGGLGDESIVAGSGDTQVSLGAGNATVDGGSGPVTVVGGAGNLIFFGGTGPASVVAGSGTSQVTGGTDADTIVGGTGPATLLGGGGNDLLVESGAAALTLTNTQVTRDGVASTIGGFAQASLQAGPGGATIDASGFGGAVTLDGGTGNDLLIGGTGNNVIEGGGGNDTLNGAAGNDTFVFGQADSGNDLIVASPLVGSDTLDFTDFPAPIRVDIGSTAVQQVGPGLSLQLSDPAGIANVIGTAFDDMIVGNSRNGTLDGGEGSDTIRAGSGNETIQGGSTRQVYLVFNTSPGDINYSDYGTDHLDLREQIQERLGAIYAPFDVNFTQAQPTSGPYVELQFNVKNKDYSGGLANQIDWRVLDPAGSATIDVNGFIGGAAVGQPENTAEDVVNLSATIAAHELGHLFGLEHGDAFGPIGSGIFDRVPTALRPAYPGPATADETSNHIMGSPASIGTDLFDAARITYFGEREAIKMAFDDTGQVLPEQAAPHQSAATAQPIALQPLVVPDTLLAGEYAGSTFDVTAADVVGSIQLDATGHSEDDYYSFQATAGQLFTIQVYSAVLSRFPHAIDSMVTVYDATTGQPVAYYNSPQGAFNDDSFQDLDSLILDLQIPTTDKYIIKVDTYFNPDDPSTDVITGNYELFLDSFAATPAGPTAAAATPSYGQAGGDTIIGGTGAVVLVGGSGADLFDVAPGDTLRFGSGSHQVVDLPENVVVTDPPATVDQAVPLTASFSVPSDPTLSNRYTYDWQVTDAGGQLVAQASTLAFSFVPTVPGTYSVTFTVTDPYGGQASGSLAVDVAGTAPAIPAPAIRGPATVAEGSTYTLTLSDTATITGTDPITGWTINWGDGSAPQAIAGDPSSVPHVFANGPAVERISATATSATGQYAAPAILVAVTNVPPTATLGVSATTALEGGSVTATLSNPADPSPADTAAGFRYSFATSLGGLAGSYSQASPSPTASLTFPDNGSYTVYGRIFDAASGSTTYSQVVAVSNVPPTATLVNNGPIAAGGTAVVALTNTFDPSPIDTAAGFHYSFALDPTKLAATYAAAGLSSTMPFTFADPGTYTVYGVIFDKDNGSNINAPYSTTITVTDVAPTATISNSGPINEGSSATVSLSGAADVSPAVTAAHFHYSFALTKAGLASTYATAGTAASASFTFADNGTPTVYGEVIDENNKATIYSTTIVVNNVPPTAAITDNGPAYAGNPLTVSLVNPADPSTVDTTAGFHYSFATTMEALAPSYAAAGTASSQAFTFTSAGSYVVYGRIYDKDNGTSTYRDVVNVLLVPPTATIVDNGPVNEGSPVTVSLTNPSDPSAADVAAGFHYSFATTPDGLATSYDAAGTASSAQFTFDHYGTETVYGRIIGKYSGFATTPYADLVTINNVPPTVTPAGNQVVDEGLASPINLGSFADPGTLDGPWAVDVNWGDGTAHTDFNQAAEGTLGVQPHTYSQEGSYTVTVTVTDSGNAAGSASFQVTSGASYYILDPTMSGALSLSGGSSLTTAGRVVVDSSSATAITASGSATVTAGSIQVVGGVQVTGGSSLSPAPTTQAAAVADPLAGVVFPDSGTSQGAVNLGGSSTKTISAGVYSSIKVSGNARLTLNPGVYIITGGGFSVTGHGGVTGSGVLIINAGSNYTTTGTGGSYGGFAVGGAGTVQLSPMTSGPYAGILVDQPKDNTRALSVSGGAGLGISGAIYAPSALFAITGAGQVHATFVVDRLQLTGSAEANLSADAAAGTASTWVAGQLLGADLAVYVDNSDGLLTADEQARIQDAIDGLSTFLAPYSVNVAEVSDPSLANVTLSMATTTAAGGLADGVLGCTTDTGQVTLVGGWNWYDGADPTLIGSGQYDFQTVVTHELGHTLGLGHSADSTSVMYATLAADEAKRSLVTADLAIPDGSGGTHALHAARPAPGPVVGPQAAAGPVVGPLPTPAPAAAAPSMPPVAGPIATAVAPPPAPDPTSILDSALAELAPRPRLVESRQHALAAAIQDHELVRSTLAARARQRLRPSQAAEIQSSLDGLFAGGTTTAAKAVHPHRRIGLAAIHGAARRPHHDA